nr:immunoglobulin heavy chain junction region [Macaca mulatta]
CVRERYTTWSHFFDYW